MRAISQRSATRRDLRLEIDYEYVENETVELFNRYKWALQRIGVQLDRSLLEAIVYCPANNDRTVDGVVLRLVAVPQSIGAARLSRSSQCSKSR